MFFHLAAIANDSVIGWRSLPPWYKSDSHLYFPHITKNHTIIMSKKTYESFGCKYIAKQIIPVSRTTMDLEEAMTITQDEEKVFIAGGESIFDQTMPMVHGLYIVRIFWDYKGDAYYPKIDPSLKLRYIIPSEVNRAVSLCYYERDWGMIDRDWYSNREGEL